MPGLRGSPGLRQWYELSKEETDFDWKSRFAWDAHRHSLTDEARAKPHYLGCRHMEILQPHVVSFPIDGPLNYS